jgi:hypothetical protein
MLALRHGVIDSRNICHQLHLLVWQAARQRFNGVHALMLGGIPNGHDSSWYKSFKMS